MDNVKQVKQFKANLPMSGFDMSQSFGFTASTGMILPVYQDFLNVGEKVHFSGSLFARTQPLVTAAMADVDVYLDWFFVPISMIYTAFPSLRFDTNDFISSFYTEGTPRLPLYDIRGCMDFGQSLNLVPFTFAESYAKSAFRLANHFGFNPMAALRSYWNGQTYEIPETANPNVFPMFPLAYQCIYQDYFRNNDYERRNVKAFNCDIYTNTTTPIDQGVTDGSNIFLMRYRDRHKDYFMSVHPSPIMSTINTVIGSTSYNVLVDYENSNFLNGMYAQPSNDLGENTTGVYNGDEIATALSGGNYASGIRSMFAVEKLMRISGRANRDYDSQVLAHFGFRVPHDIKHELTHLREQHGLLHIGEVVSSADTYNAAGGSYQSGSALGAIAGKGYIQISGKPYKFTAPCDGVIMCTFSAVPRVRYEFTMDKQNWVTDMADFFKPEFDKLGQQPLYSYELDYEAMANEPYRVGWQYRYSQWKRKIDRVSFAFTVPRALGRINQLSSWVIGLDLGEQQGWQTGISWESLKATPHDLDKIMVMPYVGSVITPDPANMGEQFYTDPFLCDFRANVKKISYMSPTGEPNLTTL